MEEDQEKEILDQDVELAEVLKEKEYELVRIIGQGGTAICYLVYSMKYRDNFVCKKVFLNRGTVCKTCELDALKRLNSPNIIKLYDYVSKPEAVYLFLEYCAGGTLTDYVVNNGPIKTEAQCAIASSLLNSLNYIHGSRVAHLDLKPSNIFIDRYGRLKLADFGFSKAFISQLTTDQHSGTLAYMSPEILVRGPFNPFKADVWALGVTLYFISTGKLPWEFSSSPISMKDLECNCLYCPNTLNYDLFCLISKMLKVRPTDRVNLAEAIRMKPFKDVDRKDTVLSMKGSAKNASLPITTSITAQPHQTASNSAVTHNKTDVGPIRARKVHSFAEKKVLFQGKKLITTKRPTPPELLKPTFI